MHLHVTPMTNLAEHMIWRTRFEFHILARQLQPMSTEIDISSQPDVIISEAFFMLDLLIRYVCYKIRRANSRFESFEAKIKWRKRTHDYISSLNLCQVTCKSANWDIFVCDVIIVVLATVHMSFCLVTVDLAPAFTPVSENFSHENVFWGSICKSDVTATLF